MQVLQVKESGLQLDDDECAGCGVPANDVDRSSLAEMVEAVLNEHLEARCPELGKNHLADCGMRPIEEAVELAALPARQDVKADAQGSGDCTRTRDRQRMQTTALGHGNLRLADSGTSRYICLSQPCLQAHRAQDRSDL
jgi:hypothetical protein